MKQKTESIKVSSGDVPLPTVHHIKLQKKGGGVRKELISSYSLNYRY